MAIEAFADHCIIIVFQSFFYWKCRNGALSRPQKRLGEPVSILLLLEMPQWLEVIAKCRFGYRRFNPSFTGNAAMAEKHGGLLDILSNVSILLLLEMPQWHKNFILNQIIRNAFQSFFYWKCRNGIRII